MTHGRRVLMVSPHFPPDSSAGAHRVRLLAPHLQQYGWEPTVLTIDPRDYESRLDPGLADLVPASLRVVRCRAWPIRSTRPFGVGDLGLRGLRGLYVVSCQLLEDERFDALFITILPSYPAILGPILKRRFNVRFILDYQDPWVGAWGLNVGGGANGKPDLKSRLSRRVGEILESRTVRAADAITAVSAGTYEALQTRYGCLAKTPCFAIPIGGEDADFDRVRRGQQTNPYFNPHDGLVRLCYVGTLLPLGFETLRAVFGAVRLLKQRRPALYDRLRLEFFGTSNQSSVNAPERVLPVATEFGVADCVSENAARIDYLEAVAVQTQATAILMMGSSERHYTASKLYPGLLAKRPILAVFHEASSVVEIVRRVTSQPTARLITYDDRDRAESHVEEIYAHLSALVECPVYETKSIDVAAMREFSAQSLAGELASILSYVSGR